MRRMTPEEWHFFEQVWSAGMIKVRLTDGWDSDDDTQKTLEAVESKLLKLKPGAEEDSEDNQFVAKVQEIVREYAEKHPGEIILPCEKHHRLPCRECGVV